jgi:hypothetical protein
MFSANRILQIVGVLAFTGMTGCASVISSFADPDLERQYPGASINRDASAGRYETPIPHQYHAYTAPSLLEQQRQFNRVATFVEVFDGIRGFLANLGPGGSGNVTVTSTADKFCDSGSAMVTGSEWMGAPALQPMSVKEAVNRSRCRTAFRDHFLR